jgi:hypothetical protein
VHCSCLCPKQPPKFNLIDSFRNESRVLQSIDSKIKLTIKNKYKQNTIVVKLTPALDRGEDFAWRPFRFMAGQKETEA